MHSSFYSYTVRFGGGGGAAARVFLHYKPKIETSERGLKRCWIGVMNAASGQRQRCFQVLLNTVMANISNEVTSSIRIASAPLERRRRRGRPKRRSQNGWRDCGLGGHKGNGGRVVSALLVGRNDLVEVKDSRRRCKPSATGQRTLRGVLQTEDALENGSGGG